MSQPHRGIRPRAAGVASRILAIACAAVFAAVALGSLGAYLAWRNAPPLPDNAQAARLAGPAFPVGLSAAPQRWDFLFDDSPEFTDPGWMYLIGGTDDYEQGQVYFEFTLPASTGPHTVVDQSRRRLIEDGWRPETTHLSGWWPWATLHRDGWLVLVESDGYPDGGQYQLLSLIHI